MCKELKNKNGLTEAEFLAQYKPGDYERPSVTVDMLLFTVDEKINPDVKKIDEKELKILLIKRKDHPCLGQWALPGGFVDIHESVEDVAYRELKEETSIDNVYMEQLYTWGEVKRDPRMRVISTSYMALVNKNGVKPVAGDDAEDVAWFTIKKELVSESENEVKWNLTLYNEENNTKIVYLVTDKLRRNGVMQTVENVYEPVAWTKDLLAFDHYKIIDLAINRLKNKVEYTPIAFNLVGEYFTLREIQSVYEIILGKTLYKSEFRRKIKDMVVKTDMMCRSKGYRPANYYKFNQDYRQLY